MKINYGRQNSDDDGDNYIREARVSYKTDILFASRKELEEWAKKRGREHGCVVVVQRSRAKAVDLGCNCGGEPKLTAKIRRTCSIKKGCPFKLKGKHNRVGNFWKLEVVNETHNHDPFIFKEGHAYLRRMSGEMVDMVARLHADGLKTQKVAPLFRKRFPGAWFIDKDIHNLTEKWRKENTVGDTPMQVFESFLINNGFVYHTRENRATNRVEGVFFCHDTSHKMWRASPHLLLIDTTYNTNMYKWPFVQYIGMTSTSKSKSFCIAHAVLLRERQTDFTWPSGTSKVWDYIHQSWLLRDKEKFVSCWMADRLNFGETTTNRVESHHANLKRHLNGANNTLHALAAYALELIETQKVQIGATFEKSRITLKKDHNLQVFYRLHYKVSIKALTLLHKEYGKLEKMTESGHTCRHHMRMSMGLPCACELERHLNTCVPIPLKSIDPFWRKLDFDPVVAQVEEEDFEAKMEELKQTVLIRKD
ncbi:protein FAR1-RELATED SEQUENCE 5-like [Bidens hawaiensis]|uniref:protein FAR1-RELATED SEQUENCE 5-like n=1 Tax=Bidens hawaiensis TaxID=980011 RepID=UPI004049167D